MISSDLCNSVHTVEVRNGQSIVRYIMKSLKLRDNIYHTTLVKISGDIFCVRR